MRVMIAGVNYAPEVTGIGPYTTGLAEHLAEQGHQVVVATTFPFAPLWRWFEPPPRWRMRQQINGVDVWRTKVFLPRRRTLASRITFDSSVGLVTALTAVSIHRVDVAICVSPPIQTALAVAAMRFRMGKLVIFVQDLPTEAASSVGMLKMGLALKAGRSLERFAYTRADHIAVISSSFARYIEGMGVTRAKITEIPNWADVDSIRPSMPDQDVRSRLGAGPEDFLVVHTGNMGAKQDLLNVVAAASILNNHDKRIQIALVGDGQEREKVATEIATQRLDNIKLFPLQPRAQFSAILSSADILLINQASSVIDSVLPSKLFAYMASGRPVLAAVHPRSTAADLIRLAKCGVVVDAGSPEALTQAVRSLAYSRHRSPILAAMGLRGRDYAEGRFDRASILRKWDCLLAEVAPTASRINRE